MSNCTDVLVNVNSTCITLCPIFLISHQIHGIPNTHFFMFFFKIARKKTCNWCGAICSHKIMCYWGVSGESKSCLGLGYTGACGTIRCHLKNFDASYGAVYSETCVIHTSVTFHYNVCIKMMAST